MSTLVVTISDMKLSTKPEDIIVTYSLGSCLGVTAYDPKAGVGGMVHCLLPSSDNAKDRARDNPFMFVNTGVTKMVQLMRERGARKKRLVFNVAGGANMRKDKLFDTGARNFAALEKLMAANQVRLSGVDVGGTIPRTLFLHLDTGRVVVRAMGEERDL